MLVAEAAAQTMGVVIRHSNGRLGDMGVLAGIASFEWDCFAVPVHQVEVRPTGQRAAFRDFKATFLGRNGYVCGTMHGTIHLTQSDAHPADESQTHHVLTAPLPSDAPLATRTALREVGGVIECDIAIQHDCPVFVGHFPGAPITPGVLIAEMMIAAAQELLPGPTGLRRIEDMVFSAPLYPGETVTLRLKPTGDGAISANMLRGGKRIARARLHLAALPAILFTAKPTSLQNKGLNTMETIGFSAEIAEKIRNVVIYEGLELDELGIGLDEIGDDVLLFDASGLDLDSVDALEVLAGVQREFGVQFAEIDQAFIAEHCSTVGRLARAVSLHMHEKAA